MSKLTDFLKTQPFKMLKSEKGVLKYPFIDPGEGYSYNSYFYRAIKKYGWDNFKHDIIISGISKDMACQLEIALIAQFRTNEREFGYNISEGGETCDIIKAKTGIEHPNHKRVKQISPVTLEVIRIYDTQTEAADTLGISRKCITKACRGILNTYKGFIWEYADEAYNKPVHNGIGRYNHAKHNKSIAMVDTNGVIYHFDSVKKAAEITGISRSNISRYLKGVRSDRTGRRWCYVKS